MIHVKLTYQDWPIERQSPSQLARWGNYRFSCNLDVKTCDYWVVYEGIAKKESVICPKENTILITAEPPTLKSYKPEFLRQFATIITCHRGIDHPRVVLSHPGLPWHVGRRQKEHVNISFSKDYDELKAMPTISKNKLISVICSDKSSNKWHQKRFEFVHVLKEHFGSRLDLFGRGINEIEDKWDALADYKYHIALENSSVENYFTEKLSDAYLAGCYPIYYGCPNIDQYFNPESLTMIDIDDPDASIQKITECLDNQLYEKAKDLIWESRTRVLDLHNLFPMIASHIDKDLKNSTPYQKPVKITVRKEPSDSNVLYQIKNSFKKMKNSF